MGAAAAMFMAPAAFAQSTQPTTQSTPTRPEPFQRRGDGRRVPGSPGAMRPGEWRRGGGGGAPTAASQPSESGPTTLPAMTEEEHKRVEEFLKKNAPQRYAKIQDLSEERQKKVIDAARLQYRGLERLKNDDPQLYEIRIKRLPIMDDLFALGWDLRHGESKTADATKQKVRQRVRDLIDSRVEELNLRIARSEDRIERIKTNLAREQGALSSLQSTVQQATTNREALVERGMTAIQNESGAELRDLAAPPPPRQRPDGSGNSDENGNTSSASLTEESSDADTAAAPAPAMQ